VQDSFLRLDSLFANPLSEKIFCILALSGRER
jgi:hypothetical protein